jgi:hypothetical protein
VIERGRGFSNSGVNYPNAVHAAEGFRSAKALRAAAAARMPSFTIDILTAQGYRIFLG